jgi:hypothetical protein
VSAFVPLEPTRRLPQAGKEYLGLDVTAFPEGKEPRWPLPVAVFELENSPSDNRVAYSLWKVLSYFIPAGRASRIKCEG